MRQEHAYLLIHAVASRASYPLWAQTFIIPHYASASNSFAGRKDRQILIRCGLSLLYVCPTRKQRLSCQSTLFPLGCLCLLGLVFLATLIMFSLCSVSFTFVNCRLTNSDGLGSAGATVGVSCSARTCRRMAKQQNIILPCLRLSGSESFPALCGICFLMFSPE